MFNFWTVFKNWIAVSGLLIQTLFLSNWSLLLGAYTPAHTFRPFAPPLLLSMKHQSSLVLPPVDMVLQQAAGRGFRSLKYLFQRGIPSIGSQQLLMG